MCPRGNEAVLDYGPRCLWNVSLIDGGGWDRCVGIMKTEPPVSLDGRESEIVKRKKKKKRREKIKRSEGCQTRARGTSGKRTKSRWAVGMWTGQDEEMEDGGGGRYQVGRSSSSRESTTAICTPYWLAANPTSENNPLLQNTSMYQNLGSDKLRPVTCTGTVPVS